MKRIKALLRRDRTSEEGHAYAWGSGGLLTLVLIVILLIIIF